MKPAGAASPTLSPQSRSLARCFYVLRLRSSHRDKYLASDHNMGCRPEADTACRPGFTDGQDGDPLPHPFGGRPLVTVSLCHLEVFTVGSVGHRLQSRAAVREGNFAWFDWPQCCGLDCNTFRWSNTCDVQEGARRCGHGADPRSRAWSRHNRGINAD